MAFIQNIFSCIGQNKTSFNHVNGPDSGKGLKTNPHRWSPIQKSHYSLLVFPDSFFKKKGAYSSAQMFIPVSASLLQTQSESKSKLGRTETGPSSC